MFWRHLFVERRLGWKTTIELDGCKKIFDLTKEGESIVLDWVGDRVCYGSSSYGFMRH